MFTKDPSNKNFLLTAGDYNVHRAANIVPLDENFEPLEASIARTGLIDAITLYKGEIVDGRRRAIVCKSLQLPVREDELSDSGELTEKEIYEIVLAKNQRRSLSKAQLSMIAAIETQRGAHTMMGIPRAVDYAKQVWDVSKVTYEKARLILRENSTYASEIFSTGFAIINGERTSMSQTYDYLKEISDMNTQQIIGEQETALFYTALDNFLKIQEPHISKSKMIMVLENKIRELK
jgi:hypothetical protein